MPLEGEEVQGEWRDLACFLGLSERKTRGLKQELSICGAVFYMRMGSPPKRRVCWFPSEIRKWCRLKGAKGEVI
jgi:hypothetical protein